MNIRAWLNTLTNTSRTLPIVILYVTEGCNLRCCMCSYRNPLPNELSIDEIANLASSLSRYGLKHIVYSGGEPLVRRDFPDICEIFWHHNIKQTLLTNGLLLKKRLNELKDYFTEIIVSLDGATAETHNAIRGVDSFDQIIEGIRRAVDGTPLREISLRTVIQKKNFREILSMVNLAKSLEVDRISFLAADVLSGSFGRQTEVSTSLNDRIILSAEETVELKIIIGTMCALHRPEFESGFISESPEKMLHIVHYFEALQNLRDFPRNLCNAPMVSAVITSTGDVQPCFFLPAGGNVRSNNIQRIINNEAMQVIRKNVKEYNLERCRTCVCTLNVRPAAALWDNF